MRNRRLGWLLAALLLVPGATASAQGNEEEDPELAELARLVQDNFSAFCERLIIGLERDFGKGRFHFCYDDGVMPRPYLVGVEPSETIPLEELEQEYAAVFTHLYTVFYQEFGYVLDMKEVLRPVVVLIFDSEDSFRKLREQRPGLDLEDPDEVAGYFDPTRRRLIQWRQKRLYTVLFHEGTHQLVDYAASKFGTQQLAEYPWFQEGFADFMGGYTMTEVDSPGGKGKTRVFRLGQFTPNRFEFLKLAREHDAMFTLHRLTDLSRFEFTTLMSDVKSSTEQQWMMSLVYAQGWAFCMFLYYFEDGRYRERFKQYFRAEAEGHGGSRKIAELFDLRSEEEWDDLDEEFRSWVFEELPKMAPAEKP